MTDEQAGANKHGAGTTTVPRLTVGITTLNRQQAVVRCLTSLRTLAPLALEVIVIDDASDVPLGADALGEAVGATATLHLLRNDNSRGYMYGRNTIARLARAPYVLNLDDDAYLVAGSGISAQLDRLDHDDRIGAIALAQADPAHVRLPTHAQPAPVEYPCYVPSFIGYGHILRRDLFLRLGGFRERLVWWHEEAEYCKRLLDAGAVTVYAPEAWVVHALDPAGRDYSRHLKYQIRNGCMDAIWNEPFLMLAVTIPVRLLRYFQVRRFYARSYHYQETNSFWWILKELAKHFPELWRERRPLRWTTHRRWRHLRRSWPPYESPAQEL